MLTQFGSYGHRPGQLRLPSGVRLLADGSGLVVTDRNNSRLCVFMLDGTFVRAVDGAGVGQRWGLNDPCDVLECVSDDSFIVVNCSEHNLMKVSAAGEVVGVYGKQGGGDGDGEFTYPIALAALPDGGLVVRERSGTGFQILRDNTLRHAWISVRVLLATRGWRVEGTSKRARVVDV